MEQLLNILRRRRMTRITRSRKKEKETRPALLPPPQVPVPVSIVFSLNYKGVATPPTVSKVCPMPRVPPARLRRQCLAPRKLPSLSE